MYISQQNTPSSHESNTPVNALPVQQTPVQQSPQTLNQTTLKTPIETSSELPKTPDKKSDSPKTKSLDSSDEICYLRIPKTELDKPEIKKLLGEDSTKDTNTEMQNSDKKSTMDEQEKSGQPNVLIPPPSTDGICW